MPIADYIRRTLSVLLVAIVLFVYNGRVLANDLFIGKYASEAQENFGPGLGKIEVNIVRKDEMYIVTVFRVGEFAYDFEA